jgi:hypothetical protein
VESLGEGGKYNKVVYTNRVVEHDEDVLYEIVDNPVYQQALTRLLKGILNVSDIVAHERESETKYYSRRMPLEKVKEDSTHFKMLADLELLRVILLDSDHHYAGELGFKEHHNMRMENKKLAFYDLGFSEFDDYDIGFAHTLSLEGLGYLKDKLEQLKERVLSDEGRLFLEKIY